MAIVRIGDGAESRREMAAADGAAIKSAKHAIKKHAAKEHAAKKHPAKKHAAKKHAAKRHAAKHESDSRLDVIDASGTARVEDPQLVQAFHHLHRAAAVISLLEAETGGDLRLLLEHGMDLYRTATGAKRKKNAASCAFDLLRAAEHLSMAGLYTARSEYRVNVAPPAQGEVARHLREIGPRLDELGEPERGHARRLLAMARELLQRAAHSGHDPHLEYELTMAAEGICAALEEGI